MRDLSLLATNGDYIVTIPAGSCTTQKSTRTQPNSSPNDSYQRKVRQSRRTRGTTALDSVEESVQVGSDAAFNAALLTKTFERYAFRRRLSVDYLRHDARRVQHLEGGRERHSRRAQCCQGQADPGRQGVRYQ